MNTLYIYKKKIINEEEKKKYKEILLIGYDLFIGIIENIRSNSKNINNSIEDYIEKYFNSSKENLYHYEIKKRCYRYRDLIVYAIDCSDIIRKLNMYKGNIKVTPIQFLVMDKLKKIYRLKDFNVVIKENNRYFIDEVGEGLLIKESIVENKFDIDKYTNNKKKILFVENGFHTDGKKTYKLY